MAGNENSRESTPGSSNDTEIFSPNDGQNIFDIENTSGLNSVKGALKFMQDGFRAYTQNTEELEEMIQAQAQIQNESTRDLREIIGFLQLINSAASLSQKNPSIQAPKLKVEEATPPKLRTEEEIKSEPSEKYQYEKINFNSTFPPAADVLLSTLTSTIKKMEMKLDKMEATRPNGFSTVRKLATDNMPGPRRPKNLLNYQDMRIEDLSKFDTPVYENYIKNIWPEALSYGEVDDESRLIENSTHKFTCHEELKNASIDNWHLLYKLQRTLFTEMTLW